MSLDFGFRFRWGMMEHHASIGLYREYTIVPIDMHYRFYMLKDGKAREESPVSPDRPSQLTGYIDALNTPRAGGFRFQPTMRTKTDIPWPDEGCGKKLVDAY